MLNKIKTILPSLTSLLMLAGFASAMLTSCAESEDTTPSMADKDVLEELIDKDIPQIVQFKEDYGTYILYQFNQKTDFAYQFEQATNWENAALTTITHDDAVVATSFLMSKVFSCYSDDYKKHCLPRRLLLVDDIRTSADLGLSTPVDGHHTAVANLNSVTFAKMSEGNINGIAADDDAQEQLLHSLHNALIADYLINARGKYPVDDAFFAYSINYYAALMDVNRRRASELEAADPKFFSRHGFFFPADDEATYFPSAEDDLISYVHHMVNMTEEERNSLMEMPLMAAKMHLLAAGLKDNGVNVEQINPWVRDFLYMDNPDILKASIVAQETITSTSTANMNVTLYRGARSLNHLTVSVNGSEQQTCDLTCYGNKARIVLSVALTDLHEGENDVTLELYEDGSNAPAATLNTVANYVSMSNIQGFRINCSGDHEDVYRRIRLSRGDGYPVDEREEDENLTTISFEKHGWTDNLFNEVDGDYRAWKLYSENGHVTRIQAYVRGFNDTYTGVVYSLTHSYEFHYNSYQELTSVDYVQPDGIHLTIVSDVAYAGGRMTRYTYNGKRYEPQYATANGKTARVDVLDANMSGRRFGFDGTESLNPYYLQNLPAVIPGEISEIPLQLFYSQYLFNSIEGFWNGGWRLSTEDKTNIATVTIDGKQWEYIFRLR